ncbi:N-acetylneuraminate 9-O-acetyltransferase-like isoform X2 [Daphnia pulicaria]|uniref:N-acetylneuraminate 9-O-acetyltransferase-like isoform X2 n=1 Tax=Daphnia pulicaria TaxID=35523 RepID=UPI001EEBCB4F|nr:N-acetylneuraminate 9-O-acetyltransferase-like isoform X2 [Daphnia pulicaria]
MAPSAPMLLLVAVVLSIGLFHTLISITFKEGRGIFKSTSNRDPTAQLNITTESPTENELPFCMGNLLDKKRYYYVQKAKGSYYDSSRLMTRSGSCQLLNYTTERLVACLDTLRNRQPFDGPLHLLFMGDSRIRQQFLNFVMPDYDLIMHPSNAPLRFQHDVEVTSKILGLRLSFKWQPFLNDNVVKLVRQWANSTPSGRPSFILLSMALWHMLRVQHRYYEEKLTELAPVLAQLSNVTRVIWLNQYPTIASSGANISPNTQIHSKKIHIYNTSVRRILLGDQKGGNRSNVQIWDSGNRLVEEYIRSCDQFKRYERQKITRALLKMKFCSSAYRNCQDSVHTGYSALSQITQLLFNDICSATRLTK